MLLGPGGTGGRLADGWTGRRLLGIYAKTYWEFPGAGAVPARFRPTVLMPPPLYGPRGGLYFEPGSPGWSCIR